MSKPLVSIITPVYNGEKYLAQTIESALTQSYSNFELIIVNDGSFDQSDLIIEKYLVADPRIYYIQQTNAGVASARNTAIKRAKGKYISFLDQDDLWHKNKLDIQVAALEQDNNFAFVYSRQKIIDGSGMPVNLDWSTGATSYCFKELFLRNKITILTVLLRKSIIDEVGLFNEKLAGTDDYEMWLRITLKYPIHFLDQILGSYRVHETNVSHDAFKMTIRDLETINIILSEHVEAYKLVSKEIIKSRLYELNNQLGGWYAWKARDFNKARSHYYNAIINKPLMFRPYYRWLYCSLTDNQRKSINWYTKKIKTYFHE